MKLRRFFQHCAQMRLSDVGSPNFLSFNMHPQEKQNCFYFCISWLCPWLAILLTSAPLQSSPELAPRAADPGLAADFYGLFDAHVPPATSAEEAKVIIPLHSAVSMLTSEYRSGQYVIA